MLKIMFGVAAMYQSSLHLFLLLVSLDGKAKAIARSEIVVEGQQQLCLHVVTEQFLGDLLLMQDQWQFCLLYLAGSWPPRLVEL